MTRMRPRRPLLRLRFEGSAIHDGRILLDDLLQFVSNLHLAIERTIDVLDTGTSVRLGRRPRASQVLSALEVMAMSKGSFTLDLDLRRDGMQLLPGFDVGEQGIERLVAGLDVIATEEPLPDGFDQGVLIALREASRILDRGIDRIHIMSRGTTGPSKTEFAETTRDHIISRIQKSGQAWAVVEGRLLMGDFKEDSLRCRLHPSTGEAILCSFDEALTEEIMRNLRRFVQARGAATLDSVNNKIRSMVIRDLEPISEPSGAGVLLLPSAAFWEAQGFEELAAEQGVYPIEDWTKLSGQWPEDADFDSFLAAVRSAR